LKVEYIAFDSFGVKAMCTRVETKDAVITLDPGISGEAKSFPLPPEEKSRLEKKYLKKIKQSCASSDVLVVTHYHYDHHLPERNENMYGGKTLLIKDPEKKINYSQKKRSRNFREAVAGLPTSIDIVDGRSFTFGGTTLKFTKPLFHGAHGTKLGYVVGVRIDDGKESLFYGSDLNGVLTNRQVETILANDADTLILDGPPTYLLGYVFSRRNLIKSIQNLNHVIEKTKAKKIILDHHLLRDYRYLDLLDPVFRRAREVGVVVHTAAEDQGKKPMVLEAFERYGPTKWKRWEKTRLK